MIPSCLKTLCQHFERHYGTTTQGIQTITACAGETCEFAEACLADVNDGIQTLNDNREFFHVAFEGAIEEKQTATVPELNKQAAGRNILSRMLSESPARTCTGSLESA